MSDGGTLLPLAPGLNAALPYSEYGVREAQLYSKVGDWIWLQLSEGKSPQWISHSLADYVDELAHRWSGEC